MRIVIVKEHFFSIGIAVLLLMTLYFGVNAIVPPPDVKKFYPNGITGYAPRLEKQADGVYRPKRLMEQGDPYSKYWEARKRHQSVVSSIYIPAGLLTLLVGSFWLKLELLSTAFIFGGLFMMITAIASGWESYPLRFIASVLTLLVVIWIVGRKFQTGRA